MLPRRRANLVVSRETELIFRLVCVFSRVDRLGFDWW
jgi:hypothetical protein